MVRAASATGMANFEFMTPTPFLDENRVML